MNSRTAGSLVLPESEISNSAAAGFFCAARSARRYASVTSGGEEKATSMAMVAALFVSFAGRDETTCGASEAQAPAAAMVSNRAFWSASGNGDATRSHKD